ncbi:MAG: hypothetical protein HY400_06235 [Elusimicrobia bacterium]|nr:hypothetical protein [Elusimicrobiota bacterium]
MKKTFAFLISCVVLVGWAPWVTADPYGDFTRLVQDAYLKPFAKDLGGVLGAGTFHSGKSLGFPGFDVGVHAVIQAKPNKDDQILNLAGVKAFGLPWIQAEVGLPFRVDVIVHGIGAAGLTLAGGGLRYGLLRSALPLMPQISISGFVDSLNHDFFSVTHLSANVSASVSVPIVTPYVGVGLDSTRLKVKQATTSALVGLTAKTTESRLTAGLSFTPFPLVYLHGGYNLMHGESGYELGLGVRF